MMAAMGKNLPPRVFTKHGRYYLVTADGARRVWRPLTRINDGLPELYRMLAQIETAQVADDRMPAVIAAWQRDVMPRHATKTQIAEIAQCKRISAAFVEFRASQVQAPDVAQFLQPLRVTPKTHNAYRGMLRELLRYSIERGFRTDQPCDHIKTLPTPARTRYVTDSEMRRIKVGGIYGDDGKRTRSGAMLAALIDVAYLTGQRIGDLLELQWKQDPGDPDAPHVTPDGLRFRPSKTRQKTGAAVIIEWTPRLRDVVDRLRKIHAARLLKRRAEQRVVSGYLFTTQAGQQFTYYGASTAWKRAVRRSGVQGVTFHDLRAKALTDKEGREGMGAARTMGTHSTETQTSDYVRHRTARRTGATR